MMGSNAIDRALERLEQDFAANLCGGSIDAGGMVSEFAVRDWIRSQSVLTDLAAERFEEGFIEGATRLTDYEHSAHVNRERAEKAEARLAAVVERIRHGIDWETYEGHESFHEFCVELEALARGEGGEQDELE